jgi:hypothetical protein
MSEKELLKIMKKDPAENSPLWMMLTVNPCHGRVSDSRNEPEDMLFYFLRFKIFDDFCTHPMDITVRFLPLTCK